MKMYRAAIVILVSLFMAMIATAQTDPLVEKMVQAVSKNNVRDYVQTLEDFQTRYTYTRGNTDAGDWLYNFFDNLGIEVERHQFTYSGNTEENIIARIPGRTAPEEIVAISGHFDSTSNQPYDLAPGADDDASGIAAILEAALILKDYQFDRTVEFMCFNAEEQGRKGSQAIASDYKAVGKNIIAVLNSDMIGYWPTGWQRDLDVAYEPISEWLADHVISVSNLYVGIPIAKHPSGVCKDDHVSFTYQGYAAVTNMDCWEAHNGGVGGESTPHYHKTTDTLSTLNLDCMTEVVQVNVASVAALAGPLSLSGDATQISAQTGGSVTLTLTAGPEEANRNYLILGSASGTQPGTPLPGGIATLPLNWDVFTDIVLSLTNTPVFLNFLGILDGSGSAAAQLNAPPLPPVSVGVKMNYANCLNNPFDFASNPVEIEIVP